MIYLDSAGHLITDGPEEELHDLIPLSLLTVADVLLYIVINFVC